MTTKLDETKETNQDTHPKGKAPGSGDGTTPKEEPKTLTESQAKEREEKAAQKARIAAGRDAKALETREQRVKDAEVKAEEEQREKDAVAIKAADGDPERLTALQIGRQNREDAATNKKEKERLEQVNADQEAAIEAANATKLETDIWGIAEEEKVDPAWLKSLAVKYKISDKEALREIAKGASSKKPFNPYSGKTIGGGEQTEQEQLDRRYPSMKK